MKGQNVTGYGLGISSHVLPCEQTGFYSDVVECSTIERRVSVSILGQGLKMFLRARDINITFKGGGGSPYEGYINYEYISFLNVLYRGPLRN